jgi:hypothetical protein
MVDAVSRNESRKQRQSRHERVMENGNQSFVQKVHAVCAQLNVDTPASANTIPERMQFALVWTGYFANQNELSGFTDYLARLIKV